MNKITKIFWLEDEYENMQNGDFDRDLKRNFSLVKKFTQVGTLVEELIQLKNKNKLKEDKIFFVIDIMLPGEPTILVPEEWSGEKETYFETENGYKAGIVFCEHFLIRHGKKNFGYIPPVIFLSTYFKENVKEELNKLKKLWMQFDSSNPKLYFVYKFENSASEKLIKKLKEWANE